jgi:hypothetical protein
VHDEAPGACEALDAGWCKARVCSIAAPSNRACLPVPGTRYRYLDDQVPGTGTSMYAQFPVEKTKLGFCIASGTSTNSKVQVQKVFAGCGSAFNDPDEL